MDILNEAPETARLEWLDSNQNGQPFVKGSMALHCAANDGKLRLAQKLIDYVADVNASNARWFRSVLSWAANNARVEMIKSLLASGAKADSLDALHAAAWGGSDRGQGKGAEYAETLKVLIDAGADINDRRYPKSQTPLAVHFKAVTLLRYTSYVL